MLYSLAIVLNVDEQVRDRSGLSERSAKVCGLRERARSAGRHRQAPASWRPSLPPAFPATDARWFNASASSFRQEPAEGI